jgi:uncharacterized damage-inducible protein DinB
LLLEDVGTKEDDVSKMEQIADRYRAVTLAGAWYGPTVAEMIAKTAPELATVAPMEGAHSIANLLQHLLLWNERIRNTSESCPMPKWEAEKEWAEAAIPWEELVARWNRSRDLLEDRMRSFPDADLGKQTPGRTYPYEKMWEGILQHAIYHSGQIAMVLSMVKRKSE